MGRTCGFLVLFLIDFCFKQNTMGFKQHTMCFKQNTMGFKQNTMGFLQISCIFLVDFCIWPPQYIGTLLYKIGRFEGFLRL